MGKASKWIKNFLLAKKEEKKVPTVTYAGNWTAIVPSTPRVRRRWSFGRLKSKEIFHHKFCKSLDATDVSILPVQLMIDFARTRNISPCVAASREPCYDFRDNAAIKIQAVFRSFLARKALCALRGLVKIQALVRGYLVRKRTSATLRCMHALMTIQVRARVKRIQMAEGEQRQHRSTFYPSRLRYENRVSEEQQPSYMGNTTSSKAKERAQSEPKQRPISVTRDKGRKSVSIERTSVYVVTGKRSEPKQRPISAV